MEIDAVIGLPGQKSRKLPLCLGHQTVVPSTVFGGEVSRVIHVMYSSDLRPVTCNHFVLFLSCGEISGSHVDYRRSFVVW